MITVPLVQKIVIENTEKAYNEQVTSFEKAAKNWANSNIYGLNKCSSDTCENLDKVTLKTLKDEGFLENRDIKNPTDSWISAGYAIFYWMMNRFYHLARYNLGLSPLINGTGFMVKFDIIKPNGWQTITLTEDIEFSLNKYEHKKSKEKVILKNNIIPIYLSLDNQEETKLIDQVLTFDEAVIKAEEYSIKQMESKLNGKEYIIRSKNLKSVLKDSKIELEMFFAVYEDITAYMEIGEEDAKK